MEFYIKITICIHAVLGSAALLSGVLSVLAKKGSNVHKKTGIVFTYALFFSTVLSIGVALCPNHENPFLLLLGVFTCYLLITGNRVLMYKNPLILKAKRTDIWFSLVFMLLSLLVLIGFIVFVFLNGQILVLYLFFRVSYDWIYIID